MAIELLRQVIPVQAKTSILVAELLHSPLGEVRRAALAALRSAPGTLTQQQHAELTPFLINTVLHDVRRVLALLRCNRLKMADGQSTSCRI